MSLYAAIASDTVVQLGSERRPGTEDLPFRLVETVVNARADRENGRRDPTVDAAGIAEAALRVLGWTADVTALHESAEALLETVVGIVEDSRSLHST
jgi:hypothetical protein